MGILSSFFGGNSTPAAQPQPDATQASQGTQGTQGEQGNQQPEPQGLDRFNEMISFTPDPEQAEKPFDPRTLISAEPEKLQQQVSQMNFIQGALTNEDVARISEGGEGAVAAMAKALNTVAQKAFLQATLAAKEVSAETLQQSLTHIDKRITDNLTNDKINSSLREANPALAHPAAKPLIEGLLPKIRAKYPDASPEEIRTHATEYLLEFAKAFNPTKAPETVKQPGQVDDWNAWLQG